MAPVLGPARTRRESSDDVSMPSLPYTEVRMGILPPIMVAALCCVLSTSALCAANGALPADLPGSPAEPPRIELNSASPQVLETLEGITPERAKAIVEHRENRCYNNTAELVDRRILPKAAYGKIKDKVKAGPCVQSDPPPAAAGPGKGGK